MRYADVPASAVNAVTAALSVRFREVLKDIMAAEACLLTSGQQPTDCLAQIHSFLLERYERGLIDDPSGKSRFMYSK